MTKNNYVVYTVCVNEDPDSENRYGCCEAIRINCDIHDNLSEEDWNDIKRTWAEKTVAYKWFYTKGLYFDIFKTDLAEMSSVESTVDDTMPEKTILSKELQEEFDNEVKTVMNNLLIEKKLLI